MGEFDGCNVQTSGFGTYLLDYDASFERAECFEVGNTTD